MASTHGEVPLLSPSAAPFPEAPQVLLLDDDPLITQSIATLLQLHQPTWQLLVFNHPKEALAHLSLTPAEQRPHVILSDFHMPGLSGLAFLEQARPLCPHSSLLILTGFADKQSALAAINSQVNLFRLLEKPWDNTLLVHTLEQALAAAQDKHALAHTRLALQASNHQLAQLNHSLEAQVAERTEALRTAWATLDALFTHTADGLALLNAQGQLERLNPILQGWLGLKPKQKWKGQPLAQWIGAEAWAQLQATPNHGLCELTLPHPQGEGMVTLEASRGELQGKRGQTAWVLRDISQRKTVERLRDDFMATLTHDLRVPLLAALQAFNLLQTEAQAPLSPTQHTILSTLHQSHTDLLRLVNTLLDVYRYEAGSQPLIPAWEAPFGLVDEVMALLAPLAPTKGHTLVHNKPNRTLLKQAKGLALWVDKPEVKRVFQNLIANALAHTPAGGLIEVGYEISDTLPPGAPAAAPPAHPAFKHWWVVWVKDNGQGIAPEVLATLFQRFAQGSAKKRNSGSGLGLYLSAQILKAHQGLVWVQSPTHFTGVQSPTPKATKAPAAGGPGTCFFVALPLYQC
jgi:signal transduction histidine kinase